MKKPLKIAIAGATGAVGMEIIHCLEERHFPVAELRLLASARSQGKKLTFCDKEIITETLNEHSFNNIDVAFFSVDSETTRQFVPLAVKAGAVVIDNSSAYRMEPHAPLIIPEINPEAIKTHKGIIANPNCSTIIAITPLWPIHQINPIRRLIISTYQAASGAGALGMTELLESTRAYLEGRSFAKSTFPHDYAFNLFSHNSKVDLTNGYNEEENKMLYETRKIWGDPTIRVSATCVRVPVLRAHSEAIHFECENPINPTFVREILSHAKGVKVVDDIEQNYFPMPSDASGQGHILAGRIRQDVSDPSGKSIALFVSGDQLLKGAALNAVQIAELL